MNKNIKRKWVKRLKELPNERQGKRSLRKGDKMCCLGVLCEIAVEEGIIPPPVVLFNNVYTYGGERNYLPNAVSNWAGLDSSIDFDEGRNPRLGRHSAANYNDDFGKNFDQIANLINRYL